MAKHESQASLKLLYELFKAWEENESDEERLIRRLQEGWSDEQWATYAESWDGDVEAAKADQEAVRHGSLMAGGAYRRCAEQLKTVLDNMGAV